MKVNIKSLSISLLVSIVSSCERDYLGENLENPVASFELLEARHKEGDTAKVKDNSFHQSGEIVKWNWDFGNGDTSDKRYPTYVYEKEGEYVIQLSVTDTKGRKSENVYSANIRVVSNKGLPPEILWKTEIPYFSQYCSFSVSQQGVVHIGTDGKSTNPERGNNIIAVKDGKIIWSHLLSNEVVRSTPTVTPSGVSYYADYNGLTSFDIVGNIIWQKKVNKNTDQIKHTSPTFAKDGTIYIGSENGNLSALNSLDGSVKWRFKTGANIRSTAVLDSKGNIYIASNDDYIYKLSPSGKQLWKSYFADYTIGTPSIDERRNTIYITGRIPGNTGVFSAFDMETGNLKWKNDTRANARLERGGTSIALDGTIYAGGQDKKMVAYNPDGSVKWQFSTEGDVFSAPAIDDKGQIYFGDGQGFLYILNSDGQIAWKTTQFDDMIEPSVNIDDKGNIYVLSRKNSTRKGYLYVLKTNATSYAKDAPWAMLSKNPQRSGSNMR